MHHVCTKCAPNVHRLCTARRIRGGQDVARGSIAGHDFGPLQPPIDAVLAGLVIETAGPFIASNSEIRGRSGPVLSRSNLRCFRLP